jgi:hypothetical protein
MLIMRFLIFLFLLLGDLASIALAGPQIELVPNTADFGIVPNKANYFWDIVVKSTGNDTLIIDSLDLICSCIKFPLGKNKFAPGDSAVVRLVYKSESFVGQRDRHPHFYTNASDRPALLAVRALGPAKIEEHRPINVKPYRIMASQFGKEIQRKFSFTIANYSEDNVPLKLLYFDNEYFDINFPPFVPPKGTVSAYIILNDKGIESEFEKSLTFEYINSLSEKKNFSIPIVRKMYKR